MEILNEFMKYSYMSKEFYVKIFTKTDRIEKLFYLKILFLKRLI